MHHLVLLVLLLQQLANLWTRAWKVCLTLQFLVYASAAAAAAAAHDGADTHADCDRCAAAVAQHDLVTAQEAVGVSTRSQRWQSCSDAAVAVAAAAACARPVS